MTFHRLRWAVLSGACALSSLHAAPMPADATASLRAKHESLSDQLPQNPFGRPLVLESSEAANRLQGEIYATVDFPFDRTRAGLNSPQHWCDVMSLHLNTKYCRAESGATGPKLQVRIGKKTAQEVDSASRVDFSYQTPSAGPDYLRVLLDAKDGPMGTSDYRIDLEAVALPNGKTFLHLSYSYAFNFTARIAMQAYLKTLASDKVGFTVLGSGRSGPEFIGGMRGLVERNAMRYYLAIDAFLDSMDQSPGTQLPHRLRHWFTATEQYPRQLHEIEWPEYHRMKLAEHLRQQAAN